MSVGNLIFKIKQKIEYSLQRGTFLRFEKSIHPLTTERHDDITRWAANCVLDQASGKDEREGSPDPVVTQGAQLVEALKEEFRGKYSDLSELRILAFTPSSMASPAGYSLLSNLLQSLNYLGIAAQAMQDHEGIEGYLETFRPTVFLIGDYAPFLAKVEWDAVARYRSRHPFRLGITASLEEYGNTPLKQRLAWAEEHDVDFYFSFRSPEYIRERRAYLPIREAGFPILSVEFGANPLQYYPVPGFPRDLDYVFLASSNFDKWDRYCTWLKGICSQYPGYIDGPGWSFARDFVFQAARDRFLYARAKVGLNLHITEQIEWACELNERTYMLAACGVPQLIDNPKLLSMRFSPKGFFVASNPKEYEELFVELVQGNLDGTPAALVAQKEVLTNYTTFHRAESFALSLSKLFKEC